MQIVLALFAASEHLVATPLQWNLVYGVHIKNYILKTQ